MYTALVLFTGTPEVCVMPLRAIVFALLAAPLVAADNANTARLFFDKYCIACHNAKARTAGLALDLLDTSRPGANAESWERVITKLRAQSMPPPGIPRPDSASYRAVASSLEDQLD